MDLTSAAMRFGPAKSKLRAVYAPAESWEIGSLSPALALDIPPPPRVPLPIYFVPLVGLLLALGAAALVRSGQLSAWWDALADRLRPQALRRGSASDRRSRLVEAVDGPLPTGVKQPRHEVAGFVWDSHLDLPIAGAEVSATSSHAVVVRSRAAAHGFFVIGPLAPGAYTLLVERPGYVPESIPISIPHAGYLSRCRIRLTPLRALTGRAYDALVAARGSGDLQFGVDTPRDIARLLGELPDLDPAVLQELTDHFEALYFGGDHRVTPQGHKAALRLMEAASSGGAEREAGDSP